MKFGQSFLLTLACGSVVLTAPHAYADDLLPSFVTNLTGTLKVSQNIPCNHTINVTTPVSGGRFTLTPATGVDVIGGKQFSLVGATIAFVPFTASGSCLGFNGSQNYSEIEVQLVKGATFVATPVNTGVYNLTIPKNALVFYEGSIVNNAAENGYMVPAQDVTGTIDLAHGTASVHVVINTSIHFREGCFMNVCVIDETDSGTLTTDVSGTIALPDTDGDSVPDVIDNCPLVPNPTQAPVPSPTIKPPPNLTLLTCTNTRQFGLAFAADVCFGGPVTVTNSAPATFAVGANTVLWTATDMKNQMASATQTVTVVDKTPPVFTFVPPGLTMNTCGPANLGTAAAADDCAGSVSITNNAPGYFLVGATTVTWTATDASGNQTNATQVVTVIDTTPPTVSCTPAQPPGNAFQIAASDACGPPTVRLGSFVLGDNEIVKIVETGRPGVRLVGTVGPNHIRFFQVGKGEAIIVATDGSGNMSSAACR